MNQRTAIMLNCDVSPPTTTEAFIDTGRLVVCGALGEPQTSQAIYEAAGRGAAL